MSVPLLYQDAYQKVLDGKAGRTLCVKLKCLDCSGWQRAEVTNCPVVKCPLWHVRPFQKDEE